MKNKLLFGMFLFAGAGIASAQQNSLLGAGAERAVSFHEKAAVNNDYKPAKQNTPKAGTPVWSDDFSDANNWVINNDGETAADRGWSLTTNGSYWYNGSGLGNPINSTSGGTFAFVKNGNYSTNTQAIGVTYTIETAYPIDVQALAGTNEVNLKFEQFGTIFNDEQIVQVSIDGGATWSDVYTQSSGTRPFFNGTNPEEAIYGNPEVITIDISTYIAADPSNVSIRFYWSKRRAIVDNTPNAWTTFGWKIDDVAIIPKVLHDVVVEESDWSTRGLKYYQVPVNQAYGIGMTAKVKNGGLNALTNIILDASVSGADSWADQSSPIASLAALAIDSVDVEYMIPAVVGQYDVARSIVHDETDDDPSNNQLSSFSFRVTDYIYARDNALNNVATGYTFNNDETQYEVGNYFEVFTPQVVYSIDAFIHASSDEGSTFQAVLYEEVPGMSTYEDAFSLIAETDYYVADANNLGTMVTMELLTANPITLVPGKAYYIAAISLDGLIQFGTGGSSDGLSYMYIPGDGNYLQNYTPMVRLNFQDPTTVSLNTASVNEFSIFPNPATDKATVRFSSENASDVSVQVIDITGKVIETVSLNNVAAGVNSTELNTTGFASGIYSVVVTTNDSSVTKKLVIK